MAEKTLGASYPAESRVALVAQERQATRQRTADVRAEDRQRRVMEATALRDLRAREAANARAAHQHLAGLREVERAERRAAEAERRENATRRQHAADTRYLSGLRKRHDRDQRREHDRAERDTMRHGRKAWSRGRAAFNSSRASPAAHHGGVELQGA